MKPEWFVTSACAALPHQVSSIVLFGSAATGDFVEGSSGYDLLVVVEKLGILEVEALAETVRKWRKAQQPIPLLFTQAQLVASADAFALEFSEMKESRRILFGEDPIKDLAIDPAHVRIQLERELKGKWLALRDRYALAAGNERRVAELLGDSLSAFLSLFRHTLRLYQDPAPSHKLNALRALAEHIQFDPQPFFTVALMKANGLRAKTNVRELFSQYLNSIEIITRAVDERLQSE